MAPLPIQQVASAGATVYGVSPAGVSVAQVATPIQAEALTFAIQLDHSDWDDALLDVGELLGGLSTEGFAADLLAALRRIEDDMIAEARNPDVYRDWAGNVTDVGAELQARIDRAQDVVARDWLRGAQALARQGERAREAA